MIRILYRHHSGTVIENIPSEELMNALQDKQATIWIDMLAPMPNEYDLILRDGYQFHPLAVEDAGKDLHVPKVDDYGTYLFLVFHTFTVGDERMDIHTSEIDVFLGDNYLITIHPEPRPAIDLLWESEYHQEQGLARGPAFLLYELLDRQIDGYIPILDRFENRLEILGDLIFESGGNQNKILNDMLTAKSSALRLRRFLIPQRDLLDRLSWDDYSVIPPEARIYFHDVYDHLVRLADLSESMRDLASSTIETHLAIANNRMNEIMKVLTMISTIFIPLSFLSSVYGMNFNFMPELNWAWSYPLLWCIFLLIVSVMFWLFRRRGWL